MVSVRGYLKGHVVWFFRATRTDWHSFNLSVRMLDPRIIDREHLVEGLAGEFEKGQGQEE